MLYVFLVLCQTKYSRSLAKISLSATLQCEEDSCDVKEVTSHQERLLGCQRPARFAFLENSREFFSFSLLILDIEPFQGLGSEC